MFKSGCVLFLVAPVELPSLVPGDVADHQDSDRPISSAEPLCLVLKERVRSKTLHFSLRLHHPVARLEHILGTLHGRSTGWLAS